MKFLILILPLLYTYIITEFQPVHLHQQLFPITNFLNQNEKRIINNT